MSKATKAWRGSVPVHARANFRNLQAESSAMAALNYPDGVFDYNSEEIPKGFGKCDIFVPGKGGDPAVAVEIKTSVRDLPIASARKARDQIFEKGCASEPLDGGVVWIA